MQNSNYSIFNTYEWCTKIHFWLVANAIKPLKKIDDQPIPLIQNYGKAVKKPFALSVRHKTGNVGPEMRCRKRICGFTTPGFIHRVECSRQVQLTAFFFSLLEGQGPHCAGTKKAYLQVITVFCTVFVSCHGPAAARGLPFDFIALVQGHSHNKSRN